MKKLQRSRERRAGFRMASFRSRIVLIAAVIAPAITSVAWSANVTRGTSTAKKFGVHEIVLTGNGELANPFAIDATVTFTPASGAEDAVTVKAFYDGDKIWRARLYVSEIGRWSWASKCVDDEKLNGRKGSFTAVESNLPGKLRQHPDNPRQWATDDGQTFLNLSDTAYLLFRSPNDPRQPVKDETFQLVLGTGVHQQWLEQILGTV